MRAKTKRCFLEAGLILVLVLAIVQVKKSVVIRVDGVPVEKWRYGGNSIDSPTSEAEPSSLATTAEEPSAEALEVIKEEEAEDAHTLVKTTEDGVYILPDWNLIHPQLRTSKRIVIDFEVRLYTDRFNLSDGTFTTEENLRYA